MTDTPETNLLEWDSAVSARLDVVVADSCDLTRSAAEKLIRSSRVTVNGVTVGKCGYAVAEGDALTVDLPEPQPMHASPEDIPLRIVYEDDFVIVVDKPIGMVTHPAPGHRSGTLVNALLHHCNGALSSGSHIVRPGIVHRLDKDTGGLIICAKTDAAHAALAADIAEHVVVRKYHALCEGIIVRDEGTIDAPIGRHNRDRQKFAVTPRGKHAVTHFTVLERRSNRTLAECVLETGRTHQIRVHLSHIGHPVVGDPVYGRGGNGQQLYAVELAYTHPIYKVAMRHRVDSPFWNQMSQNHNS